MYTAPRRPFFPPPAHHYRAVFRCTVNRFVACPPRLRLLARCGAHSTNASSTAKRLSFVSFTPKNGKYGFGGGLVIFNITPMLPIEKSYKKHIKDGYDQALLESITGGSFSLGFHKLLELYLAIHYKNNAIINRQNNMPGNTASNEDEQIRYIIDNFEYAQLLELNIGWELHARITDFLILKTESNHENIQ